MKMQKAVVTQQNKILDILHSTKSLSMSPNVPHKIQIKAIKSADRIKLSTQNSIILSFFINLIFFAKIHFFRKSSLLFAFYFYIHGYQRVFWAGHLIATLAVGIAGSKGWASVQGETQEVEPVEERSENLGAGKMKKGGTGRLHNYFQFGRNQKIIYLCRK